MGRRHSLHLMVRLSWSDDDAALLVNGPEKTTDNGLIKENTDVRGEISANVR